MKVIFLDIDGVINSMDDLYARNVLWKISKEPSRDEFGQLFDERCIRWLRWILIKTDCKIVISSTWRIMGLDKLKTMWISRKLPGEVIGITSNSVSEKIIRKYSTVNPLADRGFEIEEWIYNNKPDNYCIIDDDSDMLSHQNYVNTKSRIGLNYEAAHEVVSILTN